MPAEADAREFGLDRAKTPRQVKAKYRELAKRYHPDHVDSPESAPMFARLRDAVEFREAQLRNGATGKARPPTPRARGPLSGTPAGDTMTLEVLMRLTADLRLREGTRRGATIGASIDLARARLEQARPVGRTAFGAVSTPTVRWVNTRTLRTSLPKAIVVGRLRGIGLRSVTDPARGTSVASGRSGRRRVAVLVEQTRAGLDVSLFVSPLSKRVYDKWLQRVYDALAGVPSGPSAAARPELTRVGSGRPELPRVRKALPPPRP